MTDFEYDCLQKKRIARQAKYRKCGSKSKKCNLSSDRLTHKQWKDRCGPVVTCNFNKPMSWDDFKKMPTHIQAEYITSLQNKFGATAVDLGNMFGVRALTVRKHADANGLSVEFPRGHSMNTARKAAWAKFLGEEADEANVPGIANLPDCAEPVVFNKCEDDEEDRQRTDGHEEADCVTMQKAMRMNKFSLQFSGVIDVGMIANSLKLILGDKSEGELKVICNLE